MKKPAKPVNPTSARALALGWLTQIVAERITVDEALAQTPPAGTEADQRFAILLLLTTLQHLGQLDAVIAPYLEKPLPAKRLTVSNILRLGAAQLLLLQTPAHAAVNESVMLVKKTKEAGLAGMVNAILQKLAREMPPLPPPHHNLPAWLAARWEKAYGAATVAAIAETACTRAPLDLNTTIAIENATRMDSHMLRLPADHPAVETLPGYTEGAFFVQDLAASYPARLLGDVRERQVLDLCAAPGGKTMQLIRAGAFVTALDRSAPRMRTVKANLKRMGLEANTLTADLLEWQPRRAYDAILLDAPCTATGTWRRHPEVVLNLRESDIVEMAALQRQLLIKAWEWLKPGGKLVYCVCSLEPEEGEAQAEWFLSHTGDAQIEPIPAASEIPAAAMQHHHLRTLPSMMPEHGGMDGFFAACFTKR